MQVAMWEVAPLQPKHLGSCCDGDCVDLLHRTDGLRIPLQHLTASQLQFLTTNQARDAQVHICVCWHRLQAAQAGRIPFRQWLSSLVALGLALGSSIGTCTTTLVNEFNTLAIM